MARPIRSQNIDATTTSAAAANAVLAGVLKVRLSASALAYVRITPGDGSQTPVAATVAAGIQVLPGDALFLHCRAGDRFTAITPTGTAVVNITELG
jgi:hypothetical protein